jgi:hypothetical protein
VSARSGSLARGLGVVVALALVELVLARGDHGVALVGRAVPRVGRAVALVRQALALVDGRFALVGEHLQVARARVSRRELRAVGGRHGSRRGGIRAQPLREAALMVGVLGLNGGAAFVDRLRVAMHLRGAAMPLALAVAGLARQPLVALGRGDRMGEACAGLPAESLCAFGALAMAVAARARHALTVPRRLLGGHSESDACRLRAIGADADARRYGIRSRLPPVVLRR